MESHTVAHKSPCALKMTSEVKFDAQRQKLTNDAKLGRQIKSQMRPPNGSKFKSTPECGG